MRINTNVQIGDPLTADLHLHTTYCDGKNTPEEMVLSAMEKGFSCIGFSGHSFVAFDLSCGMDAEQEAAYRREIFRLRETYQDRIRIFCGIEQDYFSEPPTDSYDYVIGSVHYIANGEKDGVPAAIDDTPEILKHAVEQYFGGDYYLAAEAYFRLTADVVRRTGADIIGHFDLFSKFNEKEQFFDESHPRYVAAWKEAADHLIAENKIFEINTGAISRNWRSVPYPNPVMIRYIKERGGRFLLSSDSHSLETIGFGFSSWRTFL